MVKKFVAALILLPALLAPATTAHADEGSGHTSTACLYERYWTAHLCPGVDWIISKAQEDAAARRRTWHPTRHTAPRAKYVTVRRHDTLWRIAVREYRNGHQWKKIARLNHVHGTTIRVGQRLRVR